MAFNKYQVWKYFLASQCSVQELSTARIGEIEKRKANHAFEPIYYNGQKTIKVSSSRLWGRFFRNTTRITKRKSYTFSFLRSWRSTDGHATPSI